MTHDEIRDYYDNHPELTLAELSSITGLDIQTLKLILLEQV